ncbi:aspartate/glutamate racemase family protein [Alloyangia mangrovi]|uniref:aspartate/glutamate racemase family protein n=1 Tax=Alloyangia mangrovi TaxID=1779329 RepID=UPI0021A6E066|nr:aspartate/glutamate racemase family protein [Alloyangia mangrovi]
MAGPRPQAPPLIADPEALAEAADHVASAEIAPGIAGVIVSAFGDPGQAALAAKLRVPVIGIGGAAARAAAEGGRAFAVVTHTPALETSIDRLMNSAAPGGALPRNLPCRGRPARAVEKSEKSR